MKFPVITIRRLPVTGIALFPFIVLKYETLKPNKRIITHELIHIRQQAELLVIPFFALYLLNYLINLLIFRNHNRAYHNIIFEREAYRNDHDPAYLNSRKFAAWTRYVLT